MQDFDQPQKSDNEDDGNEITPPRKSDLGIPVSAWGWLRMWFGLRDEVKQVPYLITGFGLAIFKYLAEAATIWSVCGTFYSPFQFLMPVYVIRNESMAHGPQWLAPVMLIWSLPFLWIALGMSVRRAADAGFPPWLGLGVMLPLINYFFMLGLGFSSSSAETGWNRISIPPTGDNKPTEVGSAVRAILAGMVSSFFMLLLTVYVAESYGAVLFFVAPVAVGAITAFTYNRPVRRSLTSTVLVSFALLVILGAGMMLFALEGLICLMMALPIVAASSMFGMLLGKAIADLSTQRDRSQFHLMLVLPVLAFVEPQLPKHPIREIVTSVEIDAPPEIVWQNVVTFPELPPATELLFRLGIACPERATIDGSGIGAIRHCIFSTGEFVEPITVWDAPKFLAFDVTSQPHTMREMSPYRHVYAPHLHGTFSSKRGEFRLIELPNGRTRLEGRTWYDIEMSPQQYWGFWCDMIIHQIHHRVLDHIQQLSEEDQTVGTK